MLTFLPSCRVPTLIYGGKMDNNESDVTLREIMDKLDEIMELLENSSVSASEYQ